MLSITTKPKVVAHYIETENYKCPPTFITYIDSDHITIDKFDIRSNTLYYVTITPINMLNVIIVKMIVSSREDMYNIIDKCNTYYHDNTTHSIEQYNLCEDGGGYEVFNVEKIDIINRPTKKKNFAKRIKYLLDI
jgi:hypothetical protein